MYNLITLVTVILYLASFLLIIPGLVNQTGIKAKPVFISATGALLLHAWLLFSAILEGNGQNMSMLNVASLISFIIALIMSLAMFKVRLWFLLPIVYSFSAINLCAAAILPGTFIMHFEGNIKMLVHISLALFAYSTLTIGALYALQLAWLDHALKRKKNRIINPNLPPLLLVERQLYKIILIGHLLLSGTLLTGVLFVHNIFMQGKTHKAVFSFIAWLIYTLLLWGHYRQGWRGKKTTWFAITGASLLTLAYFGSRFVREVILS